MLYEHPPSLLEEVILHVIAAFNSEYRYILIMLTALGISLIGCVLFYLHCTYANDADDRPPIFTHNGDLDGYYVGNLHRIPWLLRGMTADTLRTDISEICSRALAEYTDIVLSPQGIMGDLTVPAIQKGERAVAKLREIERSLPRVKDLEILYEYHTRAKACAQDWDIAVAYAKDAARDNQTT